METRPAITKRYAELDFARAIPLLGLPFVHVYEEFSGYFTAVDADVSWGIGALYACMIGPSVFMMCLGMNTVFSTHASPRELQRRGLITIGVFFALNVLRYVIPAGIAALCGYPEELWDAFLEFFTSDILGFAGLAFLFLALMKKLRVSPFYALLISLGMLTVNMLIPPPALSNEFWERLLGNFFYLGDTSYFPFLSWTIFVAVGYCMGYHIKSLNGEAARRRLFFRMLVGGLLVFVAVSVCIRSYGHDPLIIAASPANDYITDLANVVLDLSISGAWFGAAYFVFQLIRSQRILYAVNLISRAILIFFCVQWVVVEVLWYGLICFGLRDRPVFNDLSLFATACVVFAVSLTIALLIQRALDRRKLNKNSKVDKNGADLSGGR